jgi:hypothetical protein
VSLTRDTVGNDPAADWGKYRCSVVEDDEQHIEALPGGQPAPKNISFDNLDPTDFEEFCHDLLIELGFVNVDWRKGTPKRASPSDRGRDLVALRELIDVDGHTRLEAWFVDCKHYKTGVSL